MLGQLLPKAFQIGFAALALISGGGASPEIVAQRERISAELRALPKTYPFNFWIVLVGATILAACLVRWIARSRGISAGAGEQVVPPLLFLTFLFLFIEASSNVLVLAPDFSSEFTPMRLVRTLAFFGSYPVGVGLLLAGWVVTHPLSLQSVLTRGRRASLIIFYGSWFALEGVALFSCVYIVLLLTA